MVERGKQNKTKSWKSLKMRISRFSCFRKGLAWECPKIMLMLSDKCWSCSIYANSCQGPQASITKDCWDVLSPDKATTLDSWHNFPALPLRWIIYCVMLVAKDKAFGINLIWTSDTWYHSELTKYIRFDFWEVLMTFDDAGFRNISEVITEKKCHNVWMFSIDWHSKTC